MPTHVALLRGVNNLGSSVVTMAKLREVVSSLGHSDVATYIQSGNVLFSPRQVGGSSPDALDSTAVAAELAQAIREGVGVRARVVVLSREDLAGIVRDNPFPDETNHRMLHAIFLPDVPGPELTAWVADAVRQVQEAGSRDDARVLDCTVYLHTPDGYPRSELRRVLARSGGPTSARAAGTARNWATVNKLLDMCGS
jgi:uncharacterized protein (DUF1697 family)